MDLTTGSILRQILRCDLSVSAHKLATIILDGIAWKDGYNGLDRGTAAFTLSTLSDIMGVTRQHLTTLLAELAASELRVERWKPNGKFAPWLFRFGCVADESPQHLASTGGDTSLSRDSNNKTIFSGKIEIAPGSNVHRTTWAALIKTAKAALPCWNVDTQAIWDRFMAFNDARGNTCVPAGFLLGFMRRWQTSVGRPPATPGSVSCPKSDAGSAETELLRLTRSAPVGNRQFHAADLQRSIGLGAYKDRVKAMVERFGCGEFAAMLAVHGEAARRGEISP
ncbi:hypothetical protein [Maliponia aquimaris]|uniref:Replication protein n=1 Tax=Maliponia aquimaris TaxID=1673631 RepID=A0A238L3Z5_9RHOB|nr:hypothetical protein [Maliponia aquimaris]SMX49803.1 hypothetical protein MAA8898_04452 [Maliponia aquimaris]HNP16016.1 hypothetical protein [Terrimesophilobacter sp.]